MDNYRSISNLPFISKIAEMLLLISYLNIYTGFILFTCVRTLGSTHASVFLSLLLGPCLSGTCPV